MYTPIITFSPLTHQDFSLLLVWLSMPHVKAYWDPDIAWTPDLVQKKYDTYVAGYKYVNGVKKEIHAFIICVDNSPVGFAQYYNVHDFPRSKVQSWIDQLPASCASFDFYIGDPAYVGKGFGAPILATFLQTYVWPHFKTCFVNPEKSNKAAIRVYEKTGFAMYDQTTATVLMIAHCSAK